MRVAEKLVVTGLIAWGWWLPTSRATWSGFEQPVDHLCTFGLPLPEHYAAVVITGRYEMGSGRANPNYSLVFSADDGTPEITKLDVAVDEREIVHFDVVSHVPVASGASAVVALNTETLGTLFDATDTGKVLHILVPPARPHWFRDGSGRFHWLHAAQCALEDSVQSAHLQLFEVMEAGIAGSRVQTLPARHNCARGKKQLKHRLSDGIQDDEGGPTAPFLRKFIRSVTL